MGIENNMFLTPNAIDYGNCPYCKTLLNDLRWIPMAAIGNINHERTWCPNNKCRKPLDVRVRVTFEVLVEKGEEE